MGVIDRSKMQGHWVEHEQWGLCLCSGKAKPLQIKKGPGGEADASMVMIAGFLTTH